MEFLRTVTQNKILLAIISLPLYFLDAFVNLLLFSTILNIKMTKKRKYLYIVIISIVAFISRICFPDPYGIFFNMLLVILFIKFILNVSWLKAFLAEFISVAISSILELFMFRLFLSIFNISHENIMTNFLYRSLFALCIYLCVFILYKIIKYFKFHINLENMNSKNRILFIITTIFGILSIGLQFYLITFYSDTMPLAITIISIFSLLAYFFINMYSLFNTNKLETTSRNLEEAQLYNKTLILLHDSMRGFKHDFHNIVQGIGGYIDSNDISGLKSYYKQLLEDCNRVNNLTALNPVVINNPAIYNIMAVAYHRADEKGIQINLNILIDLNEIANHMKIYEFTRILGILLDNAIEATLECTNKIINIVFRKDENRHRILILIENTYKNKEINIDKIFEKSYSSKSKETNSGLGLWEIRQVLKRNNNLNLFTSKNNEYFIQQFEIYY